MLLLTCLAVTSACTAEDCHAIGVGLAQSACLSAGNCTCNSCDDTGTQNER